MHGGPLAEFAVFGVMAGAKNLPRLLADQSTRTWPDRWEMRQLDEMTVLIVGLGGIGAECARRFHALGARVWGTTRSGEPVAGVDRLVRLDELRDAVAHVDAIVVTLPGTAQTHHLIGADVLAAVKPGAIITNVGRGSVVDEDRPARGSRRRSDRLRRSRCLRAGAPRRCVAAVDASERAGEPAHGRAQLEGRGAVSPGASRRTRRACSMASR